MSGPALLSTGLSGRYATFLWIKVTKAVAVPAPLFFRARRAAREDKSATRCQCAASGLSRDGRFSIQCSPLRFTGERPSSRFRGINSPTIRLSVSYSTVGVDPLPEATNRQRAAGNGIAVMPPVHADCIRSFLCQTGVPTA
ncbi:hypothetical protein [Salmonella enterica]|uniref:hypothetical protein n=1 Tax=Salmonella enterica TaxID=28901 RepID=UPI003D65A20E